MFGNVVDEEKLGKSITDGLTPRIVEAQARFETWVERLLAENNLHVTIPLGERTVTVTVELLPKP